MKRGGLAQLATVAGAALLLMAPAPPAFASGAGGANPNSCTPTAGGHVGATTPVPISASAAVSCPMVSGPTGVPYGLSQPKGSPSGGGTPGQPCQYVIEQPVKVQVTGPDTAIELDPGYTGNYSGGFSYPSYMSLYPVMVASKYNVFMPYLYTGKYDANGQCTVPVGGKIAPGWQLGCPNPYPFYNIVVAGNLCSTQYPNAVARPGGMDRGTIANALGATNLLQWINIGTLSSLPDNSNAGLVNIGTCFFVTGANFTVPGGPPQSVQQPVYYEMSLSEAVNDGTGRYVFYVFRIKVALLAVDWNFGDGSSQVDPQLPAPCTGIPYDIAASHTYTRYGTFPVSVTEHYGATVDEYWSDADPPGEHHLTLNNIFGPIDRTLGPYAKPVLQEVGVPTTNG